jgi:glucokinase
LNILAGDIGGTNSRFALFDVDNGKRRVLTRFVLESAAYADAESLLCDCRTKLPAGVQVEAVCLAVAGPVSDGTAQLTNLPWSIDSGQVAKLFACRQAYIINDFEALALAVAEGDGFELSTLVGAEAREGANKVILGPGTGLGVSLLVRHGAAYEVVTTEAGHIDFAPRMKEQEGLLHYLQKRYGHASYERILSGPGIEDLYRYCSLQAGLGGVDGIRSEQVTRNALDGDALSAQAMAMFASILGAFAGNMALVNLARGGIYLGGGIVPSILPLLQTRSLVTAFHDRGRMSFIVESIPVHVITGDDAGLTGAVIYCQRQQ